MTLGGLRRNGEGAAGGKAGQWDIELTVVISATGLWTPSESISNDELVASFNTYVERYNAEHAREIAAGTLPALQASSSEFIVKASGIKHRHVVDKKGMLDVDRMVPDIPERPNEDVSLMAEVSVNAAKMALERAGRDPGDVDAVICSCSSLQRPYPALAIEVQNELGAGGFGYDMNVACSSATFAIQNAADIVRAGHARSVLVVNPELCTGHLNLRDRDNAFHLRRRRRRDFGGARRDRAARRLGDPGLEAADALLQQHPQQFRLPEPRRAGMARHA